MKAYKKNLKKLLSRTTETFIHELLFGKTQPPLAWFAVLAENLLDDPQTDFLSQLREIRAKQFSF